MSLLNGLAMTLLLLSQLPDEALSPLPLEVAPAPTPTPAPARFKPARVIVHHIEASPIQQRFIRAVEAGSYAEATFCLKNGATVDGDLFGRNAMQSAILHYKVYGQPKQVEFLLANGADVNLMIAHAYGDREKTPLIEAASEQAAGLVSLFLRHGANPDLQDDQGKTALMYAVKAFDYAILTKGGSPQDMVLALLAAGASVEPVDAERKTVLDHALGTSGVSPALIAVLRAPDPAQAAREMVAKQAAEAAKKAKAAAAAKERASAAWKLRLASLAKQGPLPVLDRAIGYNSIGTPEVTIRVVNAWKKPISAYRVAFTCRDNFKRTIRAFGYGDATYVGISQDRLDPGGESDDTWVLHGYDNATTFSARVLEVKFTDGTRWRAR